MTDDSTPLELRRRSSFAKEFGGRSIWFITYAPVHLFFRRLWWRCTGQDKDPNVTDKVQGHLWRGEHEVRKGRQVHVELDTLQSDVARTLEKRKR